MLLQRAILTFLSNKTGHSPKGEIIWFIGHKDLHRKNFIVYFLCQITETISTKYLSRIMILKICFCTLDSITLERDNTCKKRIFFLGEYIVGDNKQQSTKETRLQHELHYSKRQETMY